MQDEDKVKVVMLGDTCVGKTSIIKYFTEGISLNNDNPTVAIDTFSKDMIVQGRTIKLNIWDTSGQETYRSLVPNYIRNSNIIIIVFSVGDPNPKKPISESSFNSIGYWHNFAKEICDNDVIFCVCGNMTDLHERLISEERERTS